MWSTEHTTETDLTPARVWAALARLHEGTLRYPGADEFALDGPFAVGTELTITPEGQDAFRSTIVELDPERVYADRTEFDGLVLLFRHTLVPTEAGGTRVTHRLEISGVAADEVGPELGPQISGDFAPAMASLLDEARRIP